MPLFQLSQRIRRRRRTRGQSLVEFAIILPIMFVFLAAIIDLGRVFYATVTLNNAAREGAFQAASDPSSYQAGQACNTSTNLVVCRVQLESKDSGISIASADIAMTCSVSGCPEQAGSTVTVAVSGQFQLVTPLLSIIFGGQTIPMSAQATAQREYLPTPNTATLPPAPVAQCVASPQTGEAPLTVNFSATTSSGNPTDWQWDFGGGNTAVGSATESFTFTSEGTYSVLLTVINLAGADSDTCSVVVTAAATPTPTATNTSGPTATATASPTPVPTCAYPPNVIGQSPATASANLINAGFNVVMNNTLTSGQKDKIQAQNPDHTQCKALGTTISLFYRPS
jgi:PKD repeat protein